MGSAIKLIYTYIQPWGKSWSPNDVIFGSLIPRPLPAFQHSREKWEGLVRDSTQLAFDLESVVNFVSWLSRCDFIACPCLSIARGTRFDSKVRSVNKSESYQQLLQMHLTSWLGWSRAVAYQSLLLFVWTLKSWEWPWDKLQQSYRMCVCLHRHVLKYLVWLSGLHIIYPHHPFPQNSAYSIMMCGCCIV